MNKRATILGIVILAAVVGGFLWSGRRPPQAAASSGSSALGDPSTIAAEVDRAVTDVTRSEGAMDVGGTRITVALDPRPPAELRPFKFLVKVEKAGRLLPMDGARVRFDMLMPMGDHRYSMIRRADGWYEAEVTLPICSSGSHRWYATIEGHVEAAPKLAQFRFDLASAAQ